ncbi:hypothetical protein DBT_0639 [Dissulfuribacter thermophilus]|uniref:Uncharacterized protein n=1 Tax=Dissulfuribacter thermophilus TaxID=1156395 RepID=A0A1B9F8B7_9BACT|nr:hypothetical protein DBT_0639 [Dissulfuribacter thermophilus]
MPLSLYSLLIRKGELVRELQGVNTFKPSCVPLRNIYIQRKNYP